MALCDHCRRSEKGASWEAAKLQSPRPASVPYVGTQYSLPTTLLTPSGPTLVDWPTSQVGLGSYFNSSSNPRKQRPHQSQLLRVVFTPKDHDKVSSTMDSEPRGLTQGPAQTPTHPTVVSEAQGHTVDKILIQCPVAHLVPESTTLAAHLIGAHSSEACHFRRRSMGSPHSGISC